MRRLGIDSKGFLGGAGFDFEQLSEGLYRTSFASFSKQIHDLSLALAQSGVSLQEAAAALHQLFEICAPYLTQRDSLLAFSRLHALVMLLMVGAYTRHKSVPLPARTKTIPLIAPERRHDASVYVTKVYEEERKRLSRDLHDEVGHDLVLIKLYLEMIALDTKKKDVPGIRPRLNEAIALVSHAIDSVRRLVLDLGPAVFDDLGFLQAVRTYTGQFSSRTKISVQLREGYLPENIPMTHQVALYRLLQGALSNVLKHASAKSVKVSLGCMKNSVLILVIQDDGVGFDTTARPGNGSFGLTAMRERVEVLGGRIHIQSMPAGSPSKIRGTRIEIDLPLSGAVQ
ncbi:MAG: sensor histidine kinase [Acidobacteriota bacterium]|nr:sensor histidine kinase [Acidobacteriota bacterium]